ncbi:MAG: WD40 repeat domain-containing protein, partial [Pirellulales bacterium]
LLVRHNDSKLVLWQLDERREVATLEHEGWPRFCRFSPDSRSLLVAVSAPGRDREKNQVLLWDVESQQIIWRFEKARTCLDAEFSRDGVHLVTSTVRGNDPNKVTVWNTATQEEVQRLNIDKRGERHRVQNATIDFSPDGKLLVTSSHVGATIWDTSNWQRLRMLTGSSDTRMARFSPDGRQVFAACQGSSAKAPLGVRVWNVETGKPVAMTTFDHAADERCYCQFTLAPDGRSLVTVAGIWDRRTTYHLRHTMKLWDFASGREIILQHFAVERHYWLGGSFAFSPNGVYFGMAPWEMHPRIALFDAKSWLPKQTLDMTVSDDAKVPSTAWPRTVRGLHFSPDGRWLAATRNLHASPEHEVFLWELRNDAVAAPLDNTTGDR